MSRNLISLSLTASLFAGTALADVPAVAADIGPVHSLVARVMANVGEPDLIVAPGASPHEYSLRPSEAQALQDAEVVFWTGPELTPWLGDAVKTLASGAEVITLSDLDATKTLPTRESALFEAHDHGDHDPDHEEGHDHEEHVESERDQHDHDHEHDHDHAEGHVHGGTDPHIWLSPANASAWLTVIADTLSVADPDNAEAYAANAAAGREELAALSQEIEGILDPVRGKNFIVFHDAYQYFENRFDIQAAGSITVSPEAIPGAQRLTDIRAKVAELGATCIFAEPQFEPRLISVVAEGTQARTGVLDPLGADLEDGPELYFELIRNLATSLTTCLAGAS